MNIDTFTAYYMIIPRDVRDAVYLIQLLLQINLSHIICTSSARGRAIIA